MQCSLARTSVNGPARPVSGCRDPPKCREPPRRNRVAPPAPRCLISVASNLERFPMTTAAHLPQPFLADGSEADPAARPAGDARNPVRADYLIVEQAIRFIETHSRQQPSLAEIADHVGANESHLQRVFTRWAGISPKRFLQYLTHEHCRQLLRDSRTVLDATYEAGLSSAGRLHDLFVTVEGVTPGEFKAAGAGLEIVYGVHDSPFGDCLIATTPRGVCSVAFASAHGTDGAIDFLREQWAGATITENPSRTAPLADRIFGAPIRDDSGPIRLLLR